MAHLLVFRSCNSFLQGEGIIYGQHERIEMSINSRKYPLKKCRDGYNIPHSSEWKFLEYRVKKEIIPSFVRDIGGLVLNPVNNKTKISDWLFIRKKVVDDCSTKMTVGRSLLFVMWFFRYFNFFNKFFRFFPLQPVEVDGGVPVPFVDGWHYDFVIGFLPDVDRGRGEEL